MRSFGVLATLAAVLAVSAVAASGSAATVAAGEVGGRGFGDAYDWHTLRGGLEEVRRSRKPGMIVVHKSWCGACKRLGPVFASSADIQSAAKDFVMINVHDDEEPQDAEYRPDGGYIPRILFTDVHGKVRSDLYNESGNPSYKYFYGDPSAIVRSMQRALKATAAAEDSPAASEL